MNYIPGIELKIPTVQTYENKEPVEAPKNNKDSFNDVFLEKKKSFTEENISKEEIPEEIYVIESSALAQLITMIESLQNSEEIPTDFLTIVTEEILPLTKEVVKEFNLEESILPEIIKQLEVIEEPQSFNENFKEIFKSLGEELKVVEAAIEEVVTKESTPLKEIPLVRNLEVQKVTPKDLSKDIPKEGLKDGIKEVIKMDVLSVNDVEVPVLPIEEDGNVETSLVKKEDEFLSSLINDGEEEEVTAPKVTVGNNSITSKTIDKVEKPVVINKAEVVQDVVKTVKYMTDNDVRELIVKVNPKELGEIAIKLIEQDGILKAQLKASSKETYSLLSQNCDDIKKYLSDQGIKIQSVDISLYEDTTFFKDEFNGQFFKENENEGNGTKGNENLNEVDMSEDLSTEESILDNSINMLA